MKRLNNSTNNPESSGWKTSETASAWRRQAAEREEVMGPTTRLMLEAAGIQPGSRVLDIAAGTGEQSLAAARIAGSAGYVLATDISEPMLNIAAESAKREGLANMRTKVMNAENIDLEAGSFDAAICQHGLMFIPNVERALSGIYGVLRPGGKFAAVVWSSAERNPAFSIPMSIMLSAAGRLKPGWEQTGIFALSNADHLERLFRQAAFREVEVRAVPRVYRAPDAMTFLEGRIASSGGGAGNALSQLPELQRQAVMNEMLSALRAFEGPDGFEAECESLLVYGVK